MNTSKGPLITCQFSSQEQVQSELGQVRQKTLCPEMAEPRFGREHQDPTASPTLYQTSFPHIVIERARKVGSRV